MLQHVKPFCALLALVIIPTTANGHFLWLKADVGSGRLHVYFSEVAEPGEPELLKLVAAAKVWQLDGGGAKKLNLKRGQDSLVGAIDKKNAGNLFLLRHPFGVFARGDKAINLNYYAKTGPELGSEVWSASTVKQLAFDIFPKAKGDSVELTVRWKGKPAEGAEVSIAGPGFKAIDVKTDPQGKADFTPAKSGLYSIRAKLVENKSGELDGKAYNSIRHYATLTLPIGQSAGAASKVTARNTPGKKTAGNANESGLPDVPKPVTSFGGAVIGENVYIYGGHTGEPHDYYVEGQSRTLWRLNLNGKPTWKKVAQGPPLQGLAMVSHDGKLYRLGGFTAKNKQGQDQNLWSVSVAERFDPKAGTWSKLPPLPEPRSSFDAAVADGKIYVIGGWQLQGDGDRIWHKTAYVLDLSKEKLGWKALPKPPFQRRALSVAAHNGKLYAIGGMRPKGGPSTQVDVYDIDQQSWSTGPSLPGKGMEGFGSSAFATGGRLYVSTYSGALLRLSEDGKNWEPIEKLKRDRFFHRMLPIGKNRLIMVGGASMSTGKFSEVDVVKVGGGSSE